MKIILSSIVLGLLALSARAGEGTNGLAAGIQEKQAASQQWLMEVTLTNSGTRHALDIRLTSKAPRSLRVSEFFLPWRAHRDMVLIATTPFGDRKVLDWVMPVDDFIISQITLNPGEEISGSIVLENRFPDLAKTLQASDVLLFWSYQLRPIGGDPLERHGGWLTIPKSTDSRALNNTAESVLTNSEALNKAAAHVLTESQAVELAKQEFLKFVPSLDQYSWTAKKTGEKRWMVVFRLKEPRPFWNNVYVFVDEETGQVILRRGG
jgi:hypothetical protein